MKVKLIKNGNAEDLKIGDLFRSYINRTVWRVKANNPSTPNAGECQIICESFYQTTEKTYVFSNDVEVEFLSITK